MTRAKSKAPQFVKAATTSTSVLSSKSELERLIRRYGADKFSIAQDFLEGRVVVLFTIPDTLAKDAKSVPVRIPVETRRVYDVLYGRPMKSTWVNDRHAYAFDPAGYNAKKLEQAERVAWRNLILWVDAQLSAAAVGLQTVTEAFLAHAAIGPHGERVVDVIPEYLNSRRMLSAGSDE